jgi:hypothetical protein
MPFITDAELMDALATELKIDPSNLSPEHIRAVKPSNNKAYWDIVDHLMRRGFLKERIDLWDRGAEFQRDLGCFYALAQLGVYGGYDPETMKYLDRRKELNHVLISVAGKWEKPTENEAGLVTTAGPSIEAGIFNWPPPNGAPGQGEYIDW